MQRHPVLSGAQLKITPTEDTNKEGAKLEPRQQQYYSDTSMFFDPTRAAATHASYSVQLNHFISDTYV